MKNNTTDFLIFEPLKKEYEMPFYYKVALTIPEASAYSNIGETTLENWARRVDCPFVLRVGKKKLIKRKEFESFLSSRRAI